MTLPFLPNEADATWDDQAEPDSVDFEILLDGHELTGVVSGCAVTETGTPAQTIDVAAGVVRYQGKPVTVSAQAGKAVSAANGTNPRIDLISINSSGTAVVTAGGAAAQPVAPAIPATSVPLAFLYVPANDNTHANAQINDKRVPVPAATYFDVKWYGATGDGTTDDTAAIQAAIDAADTAGGGDVVFPPGTYIDGATELTLETNVSLVGAGQGVSTIKKDDAAANAILRVTSIGGVSRISDLTFDLNKANTTDGAASTSQMAIYPYAPDSTGVPDLTIERVEIKNGHRQGIRCYSAVAAYPMNVKVRDCYIHDTDGIGLYANRVTGLVVEDNRFVDCGATDDTESVWVSGSGTLIYNHRVRIVNNLVEGGGNHGIVVGWCEDFIVSGNIVKDCKTAADAGWGIIATAYTENFTISNNVIEGSGQGGIGVDVARGSDTIAYETRGVVSGNVTRGGITSHGIYIQRVSAFTVTGNVSEGNALAGVSLNASKDVVCVGNHVSDNSTYGIAIYDAGTCTDGGNHIIAGNFYRNNTSGEYVDAQAPITSRRMDGPRETYTPTNVSTDRAFDADTVAVAELADVVGSLIADLQTGGIVS